LKLGHTLSTHTSSLLILILITQTKKKTKNHICTEKETFILQREFRGRKIVLRLSKKRGKNVSGIFNPIHQNPQPFIVILLLPIFLFINLLNIFFL
jgi:hypothetical protein